MYSLLPANIYNFVQACTILCRNSEFIGWLLTNLLTLNIDKQSIFYLVQIEKHYLTVPKQFTYIINQE